MVRPWIGSVWGSSRIYRGRCSVVHFARPNERPAASWSVVFSVPADWRSEDPGLWAGECPRGEGTTLTMGWDPRAATCKRHAGALSTRRMMAVARGSRPLRAGEYPRGKIPRLPWAGIPGPLLCESR